MMHGCLASAWTPAPVRAAFTWKDYANGDQTKTMSLDAIEFIRRFLLHVPPSGFVRIRHFGFLANRVREKKLTVIRTLLKVPPCDPIVDSENYKAPTEPDEAPRLCPVCKVGRLVSVEPFGPGAIITQEFVRQDTS